MNTVVFNPKHLYIYGYSDDLIEIDGCLRAELDKYKGDVTFYLSDGAEVRIFRRNGWKLEVIKKGTSEIETVVPSCVIVDGDQREELTGSEVMIVKGFITEIWYKEFIRYDDKYQQMIRKDGD